MIVYILTRDIDLGVSNEGVYINQKYTQDIADANNQRDKRSWVGSDGNTRWSKQEWNVEEHELIEDI